jgi:hypothetical protein
MGLFGRKDSASAGRSQAGEVLAAQDITPQALVSLFNDAYLSAALDDDGDCKISDSYNVYAIVDKEKKYIHFWLAIRCAEATTQAEKLAYVNKVNSEFLIVRARANERNIRFDYYLWLEGGLTRAQIVMTYRKFMSCARGAISEDTTNVMAG